VALVGEQREVERVVFGELLQPGDGVRGDPEDRDALLGVLAAVVANATRLAVQPDVSALG
jgi:hypothetical protein